MFTAPPGLFHWEGSMFIPRNDLEIVTFRRSRGNGGQHNNKTATAIRITHKPTGVRVEACKERSRSANLEAGLAAIRDRLMSLASEAKAQRKAVEWANKPEPARGNWDRSYVLDKDVRVVDRRTRHDERQPSRVLAGGLDGFIRAEMMARV